MLLIDKLTNKVDFSKSEIIIADFIKLIHHQRLF